jgi:hypothetical protein
MEKCYYVYALLDPSVKGEFIYESQTFEYEPFYIGRGKKERLFFTKLIDRGSSYKKNKIKNLKNIGLEPILTILFSDLSFKESVEKEIELIKKIGRKNLNLGPLTNLTDGGEGRLNGKNSPESNEKMRKSLLDYHKNLEENGIKIKRTEQTIMKLREINKGENNPMWGKKHTDKVKQEQSDRVSGLKHPRYGKKHSEETIKLIREKRNATVDQEKMNEESRLRNNKAILQFSLDGEFIQEFESIKVAANSTGLSESLIGKTCRGQVKNPRKFIFKFKDENSKVLGNSYLIKEGDIYEDFKLVKRNKVTVIVENLSGEIITLKKVDYPQFWDKKQIE